MISDVIRRAQSGDQADALVMVGVRAQLGPDGAVPLIGARLYLFDDDAQIKVEQVGFLVAEFSRPAGGPEN